MTSSVFFSATKYLGEIILDFLYFPIWWYSRGLLNILKWTGRNIKMGAKSLGLGIQLRYLFKPMYGDYSKTGRLISFFARLIKLILYLVVMLIWLVILLAVLVWWTGFPVFIFYNIVS